MILEVAKFKMPVATLGHRALVVGSEAKVASVIKELGADLTVVSLSQVRSAQPDFEYVFIFEETDLISRRHLYNSACLMFKNYGQFCNLIDSMGSCVVIDNTVSSTNLKDYLFWYQPTGQPLQEPQAYRLLGDMLMVQAIA